MLLKSAQALLFVLVLSGCGRFGKDCPAKLSVMVSGHAGTPVFLNGKPLGEAPFFAKCVPQGEHVVLVRTAGGRERAVRAEFVAGYYRFIVDRKSWDTAEVRLTDQVRPTGQ